MIYLYAVYCKLSHRVKIGFSKNVSKRFKALQAHCATDLELYGYVALRNCAAIERFLHASLKEFNTHGEWYTCKSRAIEDLVFLIRQKDVKKIYEIIHKANPEIMKKYTIEENKIQKALKNRRLSYSTLKSREESISC